MLTLIVRPFVTVEGRYPDLLRRIDAMSQVSIITALNISLLFQYSSPAAYWIGIIAMVLLNTVTAAIWIVVVIYHLIKEIIVLYAEITVNLKSGRAATVHNRITKAMKKWPWAWAYYTETLKKMRQEITDAKSNKTPIAFEDTLPDSETNTTNEDDERMDVKQVIDIDADLPDPYKLGSGLWKKGNPGLTPQSSFTNYKSPILVTPILNIDSIQNIKLENFDDIQPPEKIDMDCSTSTTDSEIIPYEPGSDVLRTEVNYSPVLVQDEVPDDNHTSFYKF
eukprot:NODE_3455_length_1347_cov_105.471405_g1367_i1.p1 GENE.NODE_3455_length_1347_cov_105.471405_g1367_i1~~NODE_3455_length_1347_cov_105.471405_g1367_i1.p1  ORF type:complete len:325 (+),score=49.08 NODE_3455_length_1347_cov_105.471405_g1367_i1:141-977(+)